MITMKEIARLAGVSQPTVSVVLNNKSGTVRISDETRKLVVEAAKSLGYRRNAIARSMVTGKTNFIGYIDIDVSPEYAAKMLSGVIRECNGRNYFVKVFPYYDDMKFEEVINRIMEQRPAGLICRSLTERMLNYLKHEAFLLNIPIAVAGNSFPCDWGIRVVTEDEVGVFAAVNYLLELGHEHIALLNLDRGRAFTRFRKDSFLQAMHTAGIAVPNEYLVMMMNSDETELRVTELLKLPTPPTAIFCIAGDPIAALALRVIRKNRKRVPEDISVIGYADIDLASFVDPPLTSVREPFEEMGMVAARELLDEIARPNCPSFEQVHEIKIASQLIIRDSTRKRG